MLRFLLFLLALLSSGTTSATAQVVKPGTAYIATQTTQATNGQQVRAGQQVEALGVIDVDPKVVPSGKLFTFLLNEQVLNADLQDFSLTRQADEFGMSPLQARNTGSSASLCTLIYEQETGAPVAPDLQLIPSYLRVFTKGRIVANVSLRLTKERQPRICLDGLAFSTTYEVQLLEGFTHQGCPNCAPQQLSQTLRSFGETRARTPEIRVTPTQTILPFQPEVLLPLTIVNIEQLEIEVIRVDPRSLTTLGSLFQQLNVYSSNYLRDWQGESLGKHTLTVRAAPNQEEHLQLDLGRLFKDVSPGLYVATFRSPQLEQANWENQPTQWFLRSNLGVTLYSGQQESRVEFHRFDNLQPVSEASIEIIANNNRILFTGSSNAEGFLTIPNRYLRGDKGQAPAYLLARTAASDLSLVSLERWQDKPRFLAKGRRPSPVEDVYLTTDRNWYRGGDTIHYALIGRSNTLEPLPRNEWTAQLYDPQGQERGRQTLTTNADGVFRGELTLAQTALQGSWRLEIRSKDARRLASQVLQVADLVPLTLETTVVLDQPIWNTRQVQSFAVSTQYLSGGAASNRHGDFQGTVRASNRHEDPALADFFFGHPKAAEQSYDIQLARFRLNEQGQFKGQIQLSELEAQPSGLYHVQLRVAVEDLGGRPNPKTVQIPVATTSAYLGVQPNFVAPLSVGSTPGFRLLRLNRAGEPLPPADIAYRLIRVEYSYDWYYYRDGWRWRRTRTAEQSLATGTSQAGQITALPSLEWGTYELVAQDPSGFETTYEFTVGWGADGQTTADPEEVLLSVERTSSTVAFARFAAPFAGKGTLLLASGDILSSQEVEVQAGRNEFALSLPQLVEPGVHVLLSLRRPVDQGTEHLPQLAFGVAWLETLQPERRLTVTLNVPKSLRSTDPIEVQLNSSADNASVILFLVDEGIHAVTEYENLAPEEHFYQERELALGIVSNFGQLIRQETNLPRYAIGGDSGSEASARAVRKSDFFRTLAIASPVLTLASGRMRHILPPTAFEGRVRLVALVASTSGVGMTSTTIPIIDPVSVAVTLPRFVGTGDRLQGMLELRAHEDLQSLSLEQDLGGQLSETSLSLQAGQQLQSSLPLQAPAVGDIDVHFRLRYDDQQVERTYRLITRPTSYPYLVQHSLPLASSSSPSGTIQIPPLQLSDFDLAQQAGLEVRATLHAQPGAGLSMLLAALDRYPYGCLEQLSSITQGLIYREQLRTPGQPSRREQINQGLERLLALQRSDGAFGYWDQFDDIRTEFQPHVLETLVLGLPYADKPRVLQRALQRGLENLYQQNTSDLLTRLQALGLLHLTGFEVTSRIRYALDQELPQDLQRLSQTAPNRPQAQWERLGLAYWLTSLLEDKRRQAQVLRLWEQRWPARSVAVALQLQPIQPRWQAPRSWFVGNVDQARWSAPQASRYLVQLPASQLPDSLQQLLRWTTVHLNTRTQRSTYENIHLAAILLGQQTNAIRHGFRLNGEPLLLGPFGDFTLSPSLLSAGFRLSHSTPEPLFLNVEVVGQRQATTAVEQGFVVHKRYFAANGQELDLQRSPLRLQQGSLLTVLLELQSTREGLSGDLLLTDLLPSGFELETDRPPLESVLNRQGLAERLPNHDDESLVRRQALDDRLMAHFRGDWSPARQVRLSYVLRAVFPGEMRLPDAHAELIYQPEVHGRSSAFSAIIERR